VNVVFLDIFIPNHFFPEDFYRFLPFLRAQSRNKRNRKTINNDEFLHGVGVFAIKEIENGEELYVDYLEN